MVFGCDEVSQSMGYDKKLYGGHPDQYFGPTTYAQHGDDLMVANIFRLLGIDKPSYLDLGAHHPTTISNTRLLYERGSRGVNVDASPAAIELFNAERPDDINVCMGVSTRSGFETFYVFSDTCGLNTFSPEHVDSLHGALTVKEERMVKVEPIGYFIQIYLNGCWPHFLSCDIEGLDYDVLSQADFRYSAPVLICVETRRGQSTKMQLMMHDKCFAPYCRMGENLFFVNKRYLGQLF